MTKKAAPKPRPRPLRDAIHRATAPPAPPAPAPVKTPPLEELTCDWTADARRHDLHHRLRAGVDLRARQRARRRGVEGLPVLRQAARRPLTASITGGSAR